jgi:type IV pilus assembly protein PilM
MFSKTQSSARPKLACEISSDRVLAGRLSDSSVVDCAAYDLTPGLITPDLTETNIHNRDAVYRAIHDALDSLSGRSTDVIAVLPDSAVRVVLLDFESLPPKREEAEAVVRFRLKKSLPFDVDKAKVSYHAEKAISGMRVVAAVALSSVIEEYESLLRDAGYNPGVVLPSTLSALGATNGERPTLVLKVDSRTTSIAILAQKQLLLFRALENPSGTAITGEKLAEDVYPSVVFFQDTYNLNIDQIFVSGVPLAREAAPALKAQTGADVQDLVSSLPVSKISGSAPQWQMAGVVGALVS